MGAYYGSSAMDVRDRRGNNSVVINGQTYVNPDVFSRYIGGMPTWSSSHTVDSDTKTFYVTITPRG